VIGIADFYLLEAEIDAGTHNTAFNVTDGPFGPQDRVDDADRHSFVQERLKTWVGDSNWDGVFNSADFVQTFQAAQFEDNDPNIPTTLLNSSWATGDWYFNHEFDANDLIYVFNVGTYRQPAMRPDAIPGLPDPRQPNTTQPARFLAGKSPAALNAVTLVYNPVDGSLSMNSSEDREVTTFDVRSETGNFTGQCERCLTGLFDSFSSDKLFVMRPPGLLSIRFGPAMTPGLTGDQLIGDLLANGSLRRGGGLAAAGGEGPFLWVSVPGDFTRDNRVTVQDIDALTRAMMETTADAIFDLNGDDLINPLDHRLWVHVFANVYVGDANLDGRFDSTDLVTVFQAGHYEDGVSLDSGWSDGDWNGDWEFDTGDLVLAFQDGGYGLGPRPAANVPEPSSIVAILMFLTLFPRQTFTGGQRRRCPPLMNRTNRGV
jgi:hypothetical protein